jgi:hypothetical protein
MTSRSGRPTLHQTPVESALTALAVRLRLERRDAGWRHVRPAGGSGAPNFETPVEPGTPYGIEIGGVMEQVSRRIVAGHLPDSEPSAVEIAKR